MQEDVHRSRLTTGSRERVVSIFAWCRVVCQLSETLPTPNKTPLIPAHSTSKTRVNALMAGIQRRPLRSPHRSPPPERGGGGAPGASGRDERLLLTPVTRQQPM